MRKAKYGSRETAVDRRWCRLVRGNSLYMAAGSRRCVTPDPKLHIWQEETSRPLKTRTIGSSIKQRHAADAAAAAAPVAERAN